VRLHEALVTAAAYFDARDLKSARATFLTTGEPVGAPVHCDDFQWIRRILPLLLSTGQQQNDMTEHR
jgi:hypothetical protein